MLTIEIQGMIGRDIKTPDTWFEPFNMTGSMHGPIPVKLDGIELYRVYLAKELRGPYLTFSAAIVRAGIIYVTSRSFHALTDVIDVHIVALTMRDMITHMFEQLGVYVSINYEVENFT